MGSGLTAAERRRAGWLAVLVLASLAGVMSLDPIAQDLRYHDFADRRPFLGIPNGFDVLSNLPFLLVGGLGLQHCLRAPVGEMRHAWLAFFLGVTLVSFGSAYYHLNPDNATLAWDRLPMTLGFTGAFVALLGECVSPTFARRLLMPALLVGVLSVLWWARSDDLRLYAWVQFMPLLVLPLVLKFFPGSYQHGRYLAYALGWYVLAKLLEFLDWGVYGLTSGLFSGHTLKHLAAAAACYSILCMLRRRDRL